MLFYVMTISSVWDRKRSSPLTVTGHEEGKNRGAVFERALSHAKRMWQQTYPTVSADRFVVDFYHVEESAT